jgi:2-polyprenyl-6-methoxyphenol hydroxylase-like FAD-dependent oxidoreductase
VFGQGANSSLESGRVLGEALKAARGSVEELPATFDGLRRPDAHGLYEIDRKAFRSRRAGLRVEGGGSRAAG